jgi:hypothetical protein
MIENWLILQLFPDVDTPKGTGGALLVDFCQGALALEF